MPTPPLRLVCGHHPVVAGDTRASESGWNGWFAMSVVMFAGLGFFAYDRLVRHHRWLAAGIVIGLALLPISIATDRYLVSAERTRQAAHLAVGVMVLVLWVVVLSVVGIVRA